jgi:hypothetical protein
MPTEATIARVAGQRVVVGSREQLLHLLAEAAEIEHTLMCSYLYAAFSLKRAGDPGVSAAQADLLARWRGTIMDVAVEEMGHLVMVANLTVAVGGRPHFGRPNFPVAPGYFPSGVTVRLTGFDAETLKHFIFLERPQDVRGEDSAAFAQHDYHREQAHLGLMPSAQDYATIGHLYEAIRANLIALDGELGARLFLGDPARQVGRAVIDLEGVEPIADLAAAERAIDIIVEQGEGSTQDHDDSHYRSFLTSASWRRRSRPMRGLRRPGRWRTVRCCASRPRPRARCSSMRPRRRRCSISPAPATGCCCAAWCSVLDGLARVPRTSSKR